MEFHDMPEEGNEDESIVPDSNPGETFLNNDMVRANHKPDDIKLAQDFTRVHADDDMLKELDIDRGDGIQLGNSNTVFKYVFAAAERHVADQVEAKSSPGYKFYGSPANTPEDERRIFSDGKALLSAAISKAKDEFILRSKRPLQGRLSKPSK